ncbi:uncharacterized protein FN964_011048 [Alca torda]
MLGLSGGRAVRVRVRAGPGRVARRRRRRGGGWGGWRKEGRKSREVSRSPRERSRLRDGGAALGVLGNGNGGPGGGDPGTSLLPAIVPRATRGAGRGWAPRGSATGSALLPPPAPALPRLTSAHLASRSACPPSGSPEECRLQRSAPGRVPPLAPRFSPRTAAALPSGRLRPGVPGLRAVPLAPSRAGPRQVCPLIAPRCPAVSPAGQGAQLHGADLAVPLAAPVLFSQRPACLSSQRPFGPCLGRALAPHKHFVVFLLSRRAFHTCPMLFLLYALRFLVLNPNCSYPVGMLMFKDAGVQKERYLTS